LERAAWRATTASGATTRASPRAPIALQAPALSSHYNRFNIIPLSNLINPTKHNNNNNNKKTNKRLKNITKHQAKHKILLKLSRDFQNRE
jgi:hypothetical protein